MKVLVTGGAGFIGSHFVRYILGKQPEYGVVNLDKLTYAGNLENLADIKGHPRYRFVHGNISDIELLRKLLHDERFEIIVNFAAESHVDRSIIDAGIFVETNVQGTLVLLEAAREHGIARFVHISTDEVYGSIDVGSLTEESPLHPSSPYAASKAAADLLCLSYHKTYGMPVLITRSTNNYGPYQFPEKLIPLMIRNAVRKGPLPVYGDGSNVRDWIYVRDNCEAIALVLERGNAGGIYNISPGEEHRNLEVIQTICELVAERLGMGPEAVKRQIQFMEDRPGHDLRYSINSTRIANDLGWKAKTKFKEGLARTVDWYLQHQEWVERVISGEYQEYYSRVYVQNWR
jgi:dTDP-glucose 4,6-dehydratase